MICVVCVWSTFLFSLADTFKTIIEVVPVVCFVIGITYRNWLKDTRFML